LPRACHSESSAAKLLTSTPMRRIRLACCARAAKNDENTYQLIMIMSEEIPFE